MQRSAEEANVVTTLPEDSPPESESSLVLSTGSPTEVSPAVERLHGVDGEVDQDDGDDGYEDFEFAVASGDSFDGPADEIFSNGRIRPLYPLFDRALLLDGGESPHEGRDVGGAEGEAEGPVRLPLRELMAEGRDPPSASSSTSSEDLEGIPAGSYCMWRPVSTPSSPNLPRKSHSTGAASSRRSRLCSFVVGRSHSDGKERLVYLPAPRSPAESPDNKIDKSKKAKAPAAAATGEDNRGKGRGRGRVTEMDMVTAHRLYYARGGAPGAAAAGDRRRSFLPYRNVGFFANVNGPGRGFQLF